MAAFEVRPERPEDVEGVRSVVVAAFGRSEEAELVAALRADAADPIVVSLVAQDGDASASILGHVLLSWLGVASRKRAALGLAPVSVVPGRQGAGIGSALVRAALAQAGRLPVIVLGDPAYYARFGFEPAGAFGLTPPQPWPPEAWRVAVAPGAAVPPGAVTYPAAFGAG